MNFTEKWANQVSKSISGISPTFANDGYPNEASAIVEPWACVAEGYLLPEAQAYFQWEEQDPDNWASWIRQTFGTDWGIVADTVNIEGY